MSTSNKNLEIVGTSSIRADDLPHIEKYALHSLEKIAKISDYNNLKVAFKRVHKHKGSKNWKYHINLMVSHGKKVLTFSKEVSSGTSDEVFNDKKQTDWNIVNVFHDSLKALEQMIKIESRKRFY